MKPIFLGFCAILSPFFYDLYTRRDKINKKFLLETIKKKFQLVEENTDISLISEDYPVIVYKKIKYSGDIIDHELGLKFSDILALEKKIEIVDKDTLTEKSVQPTKYRAISNKELTELSNGKFCNSEFNFIANHAYIEKIKLKEYFFRKFQKEISQSANESSTSLIGNPKNAAGEIILEKDNKYLADKFVDCSTKGNNVFIQANRSKLLKNDLKINYIAYKPVSFILIGCKEKSFKISASVSEESNLKSASAAENSVKVNSSNKEYELVLQPATRYFAEDYVVIPFQVQEEAKAKDEIEKFINKEIHRLDLKPWEKKVRRVFYVGGILMIGYGYFLFRIRNITNLIKKLNAFVALISKVTLG